MPHAHIALIGQFKEETGICEHLDAVQGNSISRLEILFQLWQCQAEGATTGPVFGHRNGTLATMSEYDNDALHHFLKKIQDDSGCSLVSNESMI